jgi:hypothetical protein
MGGALSKCCDNLAERVIRNIKVKQKISGQFRSPTGSHIFAVLRSVTDTTLKNNNNVLKSLQFIANLQTLISYNKLNNICMSIK